MEALTVRATDEERAAGALAEEKVAEAVRRFEDTGLVVLDNLYTPNEIAVARAEYDVQLADYLAGCGGLDALGGKTFGKNHIGFFPRLTPPIAAESLAAHPIAVQVASKVLGDDFTCSFYHTNTACPGSGFQPVHRDSLPLFNGEMPTPHPTVSLVINIPLCDFTEENGSTEYWVGSHLITDKRPEDSKLWEARAQALPAIRMNLPLGSLALRDLRAWHRGMPNNADYARTMFALIYQRSWLGSVPMQIPQSVWDGWSERTRRVYRKNTIVPEAEYRAMTWDDLK
jgi:ectoine hydroxylase-related dioxygenase (phytanoyl-CoA dioxygenase family)